MEQAILLPEAEPISDVIEIILDDLPINDELVGREPSVALCMSIDLLDVINPIVVAPKAGGGWIVIDGRRRIKAKRKVLEEREGDPSATTIRAITVSVDGAIPSTLTVASHATRTENPAADIEAIQRLVDTGASEKAISVATGLPLGTLRKRMKLLGLPPSIRKGLVDGTIAVGVAEQIAKLPVTLQVKLGAEFDFHGTMTGKQVEEARRAKTSAALAQLPASILDTPDTTEGEPDPVQAALGVLDMDSINTKTTKAELLVMIEQARKVLGG